MSSQNFEYKSVSKERVPLIPITVKRLGKEVSTEALIDSGAAISILKTEIADVLGLPMRGTLSNVGGIGGSQTQGYKFDLDVVLNNDNHNFNFHVPVKNAYSPYTILGRDSIFEKYEVKFRQRENSFFVSDY